MCTCGPESQTGYMKTNVARRLRKKSGLWEELTVASQYIKGAYKKSGEGLTSRLIVTEQGQWF